MAPHRPVDARSGLVLDTHDLGRRAGSMRTVRTTVPAPADLGIAVIAVPENAPIDLDLRLESVVEGVLVTGTATVPLRGECVRCLGEISDELEVDVQELFTYAESEASEEEASRLQGELIDLEPVLRDQVVLDLPFQPVCSPDCAGLCVTCGANLNVQPEHRHDDDLDPRWSALAQVAVDDGDEGRRRRNGASQN
jgi:uncharacterized protein